MPDYRQFVGLDNLPHGYRPIGTDSNNPIWAQYVSLAPVVPLGHFQVTVSSAAVPLPSIPAEARRVVIRSLGQPINFRDDGTPPTGTSGFPILADEWIIYDTVPTTNFEMISASTATGDADVRISYYG
jgi:hypothetical protein